MTKHACASEKEKKQLRLEKQQQLLHDLDAQRAEHRAQKAAQRAQQAAEHERQEEAACALKESQAKTRATAMAATEQLKVSSTYLHSAGRIYQHLSLLPFLLTSLGPHPPFPRPLIPQPGPPGHDRQSKTTPTSDESQAKIRAMTIVASGIYISRYMRDFVTKSLAHGCLSGTQSELGKFLPTPSATLWYILMQVTPAVVVLSTLIRNALPYNSSSLKLCPVFIYILITQPIHKRFCQATW